jgi:CheY-like chemotaxis protein
MTRQKLDLEIKVIRILIIEDNIIKANVLQSQLEDFGFTDITIVKSGKEAIKLFSENFNLIFLDINLPDMNGIDIARHYRNIFPKKDTPIICCSSKADSLRRECIEAGIDDFLVKPISPENLQEILECWIVIKITKQADPLALLVKG